MKIITLLTILICCVSCATYKYPVAQDLRPHSEVIYNKFGKTWNDQAIIITYYPTLEETYKQYVKDGRINNNSELSCFLNEQDKKISINYVALIDSHVTLLREFVNKDNLDISYIKRDYSINNQHESYYLEEKRSSVKIKSLTCWKEIEGKPHQVISEIYGG